MILATRYSGDVAVRATMTFPSTDPPRWGTPAARSLYGFGDANAVTAVAGAVQLIAGSIGSCVARAFEGDGKDRRPVEGDRALRDLLQYPAPGWSSYALWESVATSVEETANAYIWKSRSGRRVVAMWPLDPRACYAEDANGARRVFALTPAGKVDITRNVIHVRGWSPLAADPMGASPMSLHRLPFGVAKAYDEYRAGYLENGGLPSVVIQHPGNPTKETRADMLEGWARRHAAPQNSGRPGMIWGGATVQPITPTLRDSQTAEIADTIVRDVARAFGIIPAELLATQVGSGGSLPSPEHTADVFYRFTLMRRLRRIERAVSHDLDVFPDRRRYLRFDLGDFLRGDLSTRATVVHMLRQDGVMTGNEGRAEFGLDPMDGADELQQTPVGGAPGSITDGTSPA